MAAPVKTLADTMVLARHDTLADTDPYISAQANGGFLIGFTRPFGVDDTNVYMVIGGENSSSQSGYTFGLSPSVDQSSFSSDTLGAGGSGIAFASKPDSGNSDIYGSIFNPLSGSSSPFLVNVGNEAGNQLRPEVCETAYGSMFFVWIDDTTGAVKAAAFRADQTSVFTNLTVSTTAASQYHGLYDLGVTALSSGAVAVSWRDDTSVSRFRVVSSSGSFLTGDITLPGNGSTDLVQLADGRILVTYYAFRWTAEGHFAQIYEADGTLSVPEFNLSASDGFQAATALLDGRFMVAYDTNGDIYGRIFNADGTAGSPEFRINTDTNGTQGRVHLDTLIDGQVAVAWEDSRAGGGDICYTVLDPRETGVEIAGTPYFDSYVGSAHADIFVTAAGGDRVNAGGGSDQLFGGAGVDFLYGEGGNDRLSGGADPDWLYGGEGIDVLDGGAGADTMSGGLGNDLLYVDQAGDKTVERAGEGTDRVYTTVSYTLAAGEEIELFGTTSVAGTAALTLTGNAFGQRIDGNNGNNVLYGGGGNDTLVGYGGNDMLSGGDGNDLFYVDAAGDQVIDGAGQGSDIVYTTVSYALGAGQEIELLGTTSAAGAAALTLAGNAFNQRINGNNGNNVLYGGAGNDLLMGYGGNDNIEGQAGTDTLKGFSGIDKFVFRQSLVATSGADHIADFGVDDFIYFDVTSGSTGVLGANAFRAGANALDADDRFVYYAPSKSLYFDPDGNGATAKILFAVFDNGFPPTAADIVLF